MFWGHRHILSIFDTHMMLHVFLAYPAVPARAVCVAAPGIVGIIVYGFAPSHAYWFWKLKRWQTRFPLPFMRSSKIDARYLLEVFTYICHHPDTYIVIGHFGIVID